MRVAAFFLCVSAGVAALGGCDRDRARSERFTIVDAGRMTIVESTPNDTPADRDRGATQTAGEVTVIGGVGDVDGGSGAGAARGTTTITSGEQSIETSDRTITQKVRQGVLQDGSLSTLARDVKIVVANGVVTLNGAVRSEAERNAIEAIAKKVPHVKHVDNELEIDPNR